jgi:hypothetical protein
MMTPETGRTSQSLLKVVSTRLSETTHPPIQFKIAGTLRRVMPRMRDREVPYGMKGGEH